MDLINENYGPVFDDVDKMNALMKEKKAQITEAEGFPEMPGIKEALKQLKDEGYLLAVASSSPAYAIKDALKSLDMEKYFTVVLSGAYVEHPKPAPDTFLVTAEKLGMEPEDCLVVEDSTNGGGAARAAGMKCIWFHNPDSGRQDIPDAVLEFPDDRLPYKLPHVLQIRRFLHFLLLSQTVCDPLQVHQEVPCPEVSQISH